MSHAMHLKRAARAAPALAVALALLAVSAAQAAPITLGGAAPFVALGATTVTSTGASELYGDLGVAPGTALVIGSPGVVYGNQHQNDAVAGQAQADLTTAYDAAAAQPVAPGNNLTGTNLGGLTLFAGAYRFDTSAQLTGTLILDAQGDPNAQFVFEIGSTLTTAPGSTVKVINQASPCKVFWQVGSSATLDDNTAFQGNLLAYTSITVNGGASVVGRVLARNGAITLINNRLDSRPCTAAAPPPPPPAAPDETPPGAPPADPAPPTTMIVRPDSPGVTTIIRFPARKRCVSRRAFSIRLAKKALKGARVKTVVVLLNGKKLRISRRDRIRSRVVLRGLAKGRFSVRIVVGLSDGRELTGTRRYRTCTRKQKGRTTIPL